MEDKWIIGIWGKANQGKSNTIQKVFSELRLRFPNAPVDIIVDNIDIKVVITIGLIKIGIESQGDPNSRLQTSIEEFAHKACDIIICSCRTSGNTVEIIENTAEKYSYKIIWATNYRCEFCQDRFNKLSADGILILLDQLMNGAL